MSERRASPAQQVPTGLYGMADAGFGDPYAQACLLAEEGVPFIQLRLKGWPEAEVRRLALRCRPLPATLILNDHAHLAADLGLWAHLGDEDGPAFGPHGRSTHTIQQVNAEAVAAYIGFGPVFSTNTKTSGWTPRGVDLLRDAVASSSRPVVAIGGITVENLPAVRATGVAAWAVVGAIWRAADPRAVIRRLR